MSIAFDAWHIPGLAPEAVFAAPSVARAGPTPPGSAADRPRVLWESVEVSEGVSVRYPVWEREASEGLLASLIDAGNRMAEVPVEALVTRLGRVADRFLDTSDPIRAEAIELLAPTAGLSEEMAAGILTGMARDWRAERIWGLLTRELADPGVLDGFCPVDGGRWVRARGPRLTFHVGAGSVPGVSVTSMIRALLVKSPVLLKPGLGDVALPVLFARTLREEAPEVADAVAVSYWPGGASLLEGLALTRADVVIGYGGDDAIKSLRDRTPVTARFVAHHHRVSIGLVSRESLTAERAPMVAAAAARAVSMFDQRGCVSPHAIFVEEGGVVGPREWAALLGLAMADFETEFPSGHLSAAEASAVHQTRGSAKLREASGGGVRVFASEETSWTVILEDGLRFTPSCLNRVVTVVPTSRLDEVPDSLGALGRHLQTVAVDAPDERLEELAEVFSGVGATRLTSFERAPWPAPWWHHDGESVFAGLIRWVDLERIDPGERTAVK